MNPTKDLYAILGVPPNALTDDVRSAYRQAARRLHPELLPEHSRSAQQTESRLNLTVVIDHSTSMKGVRMERVKVAAFQLIDQLSAQDMLSVVTFSDRAEVLIPAGPLADKQGAKT